VTGGTGESWEDGDDEMEWIGNGGATGGRGFLGCDWMSDNSPAMSSWPSISGRDFDCSALLEPGLIELGCGRDFVCDLWTSRADAGVGS